MDRKDFLRKALVGSSVLAAAPSLAAGLVKNDIDELAPLDIVGFNHLPPAEPAAGDNFVLHRAQTRGGADHGWLNTRHTFSFASYYNPERMHFGALRVLNDDIILGGTGFPTHPHDNMEIISIPIKGGLEHKDSMGNRHVIRENEIQVMSAGTGITHSEYNADAQASANFLQIWMFPNKQGVKPRYDQIPLNHAERKNRWQQILSPNPKDAGVWVHQDAWFHLTDLSAGKKLDYSLKRPQNGVYFFVMEGEVQVGLHKLGTRDGLGLWSFDNLSVKALSSARILAMDVPLSL